MAGALFQADGILAWVVYNESRLSRLPSRQGLNLPGGLGHSPTGHRLRRVFDSGLRKVVGVPPLGGNPKGTPVLVTEPPPPSFRHNPG